MELEMLHLTRWGGRTQIAPYKSWARREMSPSGRPGCPGPLDTATLGRDTGTATLTWG